MHYVLVGPGALGGLFCSIISKGLTDRDHLTVLDYNPARAEYLNKQGIVYHIEENQKTIAITVESDPQKLAAIDVMLNCVKSYDVLSSLEFCKPILDDKTLLIFLQNGISHLDYQDFQNQATSAYGTTTEGATLLNTGHVRHAGSGVTYLGFLNSPNSYFQNLLEQTAELFKRGGAISHLTGNIRTRLWAKLFISVGINALTATLNCKNGELLTIKGIEDRMKQAIFEATQIAKIKEIDIMDDPFHATKIVCTKTAQNISSMLQDVTKKKRTEVDAINGAIVHWGKRYDIATPENIRLCNEVKDLETSYL